MVTAEQIQQLVYLERMAGVIQLQLVCWETESYQTGARHCRRGPATNAGRVIPNFSSVVGKNTQ